MSKLMDLESVCRDRKQIMKSSNADLSDEVRVRLGLPVGSWYVKYWGTPRRSFSRKVISMSVMIAQHNDDFHVYPVTLIKGDQLVIKSRTASPKT